MDQVPTPPQPGAVPGGNGRSESPSNSGIKGPLQGAGDLMTAGSNFFNKMRPSLPAGRQQELVPNNPYAKPRRANVRNVEPTNLMPASNPAPAPAAPAPAPVAPAAAPAPAAPAAPAAPPLEEDPWGFLEDSESSSAAPFDSAATGNNRTPDEISYRDKRNSVPPAGYDTGTNAFLPPQYPTEQPDLPPYGNEAEATPETSGGGPTAVGEMLRNVGAYAVGDQAAKHIARNSPEAAARAAASWRSRQGLVNAARTFAPGSQAGRLAVDAARVGKGGRLASVGAAGGGFLPALGGYVALNAGMEALDGVGLMPESMGGTGTIFTKGTDALGWDQQAFENQSMQQGALSNFVYGINNPLKGIGEIGKGGAEGVGAAANGIRNVVTNSDSKTRARDADVEATRNTSYSRARQLEAQAAQVGSSNPDVYRKLLAQADDARRGAEAMVDESADWELGNQNWFGGGNKFQDAMNASGEELAGQIEGMQDQTLNSDRQADLESLQSRKNEIDRMSKLYDQESGYWGGTGDFGHSVRKNVTQAKQQLINIAAEMRQAQGNPERMSQLQRDMQFQNDRLNQYRQWAESANQ